MIPQPRTVGPLVIERKLGTDGIVEVFRGTLKAEGDRPVIVRRLHDWLVKDEPLMSAVEARIGDLKALRHPRMVRVLDYFAVENERFIIEEAVRGVDLLTLIQDVHALGGSVTPNLFLHFAMQLCTDVEALHNSRGATTGEERLLHRSIRPAAVYVTLDGSVRLGGYGLLPTPNLVPAKMLRGPVAARIAYLAPEQVDDGRPTSRATDIFSLGAVLYTLLTGEVLFDAPSDLQSIWRIRDGGDDERVQATRARLPGIEAIFTRCLDPKPGRRYPSADVLREELRALVSSHDKSRTADEVLDLLAAIGLEPPARSAAPPPAPRPPAPDVDEEVEEPTAQSSGSLSGDDVIDGNDDWGTEDVEDTDPGRTQSVEVPKLPSSDFAHSLLGPPLESVDLVELSGHDLEQLNEDLHIDDSFRTMVGETTLPTMPPPGAAEAAARGAPRRPVVIARASLPDPDDEPIQPFEQTARIRPPPPETTDRVPAWSSRDLSLPTVDTLPQPVNVPPLPMDEEGRDLSLSRFAAISVAALLVAFVGGVLISSSLTGALDRPATPAVAVTPPTAPLPPVVVVDASPPVEALAPPPVEVLSAPPAVAVAEVAAPVPAATPPALQPPASTLAPAASPASAAPPVALVAKAPPREAPAAVTLPTAPTPPVRLAMASTPPSDAEWTPPTRLDTETLAPRAAAGKLTSDDRALLEGIAASHPDYSRAKVWLYDDATARGALADRKRHIDALMRSEEHQSNPVFLTEAAQVALAYKDFEGALAYARKAEQHWARLPSSAVFKRKAMIYEQQGASWYGIFVRSDATDMDALHQSIRAWQRYRQHVQERDAGLTERADAQLSKLTDIQARVE
jgi:serine/threonine protein kinase